MAAYTHYVMKFGTLADNVHIQLIVADTTVDLYMSVSDAEAMIQNIQAQINSLKEQEK